MSRDFIEFFLKATEGHAPYPFQVRFAEAQQLPHLVRAPTGAGKTATHTRHAATTRLLPADACAG
jgi:hypothetical protein